MKLSKRKISVDIFGNTLGTIGWTTHSVCFAHALNDLTPVSFRAGRRAAVRGLFGPIGLPLLRGLQNRPNDFGVVIRGEPLLQDRSARWIVWETTELSDAQKQLCASTKFLWTPSTWGRKNLISNGIEPSRVAVVPEGVDTNFFRPNNKRTGRFRFLMVGKWEQRKFIDGLLQAFNKEFSPQEDVELYLQAHNPYMPHMSPKKRLEQAGFSNAGNIILGEPCTLAELRHLYQSANCFVLPTRAEGWGLPILESMACGVPAIVTRYSAPIDYLTEENSYLLDVRRMVDAHDDDFNIHTGQWAEPDVAHLRHLMRTAVQDKNQLSEKGRVARITAEKFTWKHAAEIALQRIHQHLST